MQQRPLFYTQQQIRQALGEFPCMPLPAVVQYGALTKETVGTPESTGHSPAIPPDRRSVKRKLGGEHGEEGEEGEEGEDGANESSKRLRLGPVADANTHVHAVVDLTGDAESGHRPNRTGETVNAPKDEHVDCSASSAVAVGALSARLYDKVLALSPNNRLVYGWYTLRSVYWEATGIVLSDLDNEYNQGLLTVCQFIHRLAKGGVLFTRLSSTLLTAHGIDEKVMDRVLGVDMTSKRAIKDPNGIVASLVRAFRGEKPIFKRSQWKARCILGKWFFALLISVGKIKERDALIKYDAVSNIVDCEEAFKVLRQHIVSGFLNTWYGPI
jgi:hypothetical protein